MPRNFAGTSHNMQGAGAPFTNPGTLGVWRRVTNAAQQASQYVMLSDGSLNNRNMVGTDITGTGGKITSLQTKAGTSSQALSTAAATANVWELDIACFGPYPNDQIVYLNGTNKNSKNAINNPTGLNTVQLGGRGTQDLAHAFILTRILTDLEAAALYSVFLNPRALGLSNYYYVNQSATENDQVGSINLTVTGTNSVSGDPNIGTWFTGTAIANQSWTQGSAITNIDLTTKFDNGVAANAPWTGTLQQLGTAGTATNASSSGTSSTALTTNAALTAGQWVQIGSNAKTCVLYVSGTTALLKDAQTWNSGDTVTPYPVQAVTAITSNGVTVNGSNVLTGTPGAGAVGSYSNCLLQAANNTHATAVAYSNLFNITIASSGAAPSFTQGPTLNSANTDGYTYGATSNQTATWHLGAYLKGSATPSAANLKAGAGTGFVAHVTQALTAATPGTLSVTGLTFPFYDVHQLVTNGSGDSAIVSNLAVFKAAPAGKQYVTAALVSISAINKNNPVQITTSSPHGRTSGDWVEAFGMGGMVEMEGAWGPCTVIDATHLTLPIDSTGYTTYTSGGNITWGRSSFKGASAAVVTGDVLIADATDGQGAPVTFTGEGVAIFATNSLARQSFTKDVYDVSAGDFLGSALDYENDAAPLAAGQSTSVPFVLFPLNQTSSFDLGQFFTDPQGDTLTITAVTSLPPNRTLSANALAGTPTASATSLLTVQAQNLSGETSTLTLSVVDGAVVVPNALGLIESDGETLAQNAFLNFQSGTQDDPNPAGPAPAGIIISQSPAAGTLVPPNSTVTYAISSGVSSISNSGGGTPPPTVTAPIVKSSQLRMEEGLNAIQSYGLFKPFGVVRTAANDQPGQVYRFFRLPASAIITELQFMNDPNPAGSVYKLGVLLINGGGPVVTGSDSVLLPSVTLDTPRLFWTDLFTPASAVGPPLVSNVGKRLWQLLGLPHDPNLTPQITGQDVLYDVALTCVVPGTVGGYVAVRMEYSRGPDRGLIAAAGIGGTS